jgi:hypothetical protein
MVEVEEKEQSRDEFMDSHDRDEVEEEDRVE